MNLAEAIKKCSMEAWEAQVPCDVFLGVVTGTEPYSVRVGDMEIPQDILYVTEQLVPKTAVVELGIYKETVVINEGIKKGDCVVLLRKNGGGCYVIAGKIQEG